jgi:Transmembrane domain of unknown function (DUF3566)
VTSGNQPSGSARTSEPGVVGGPVGPGGAHAAPPAALSPSPVEAGSGGNGLASPQHVGPPPGPRPSGTVPPRPGSENARRAKPARRPPRLASLQLKRVDPWTVLKISLIVSIVMFFVWIIATGILYYTLGAMDVWSRVNDTFSTLTSTPDVAAGQTDLITAPRVFAITAIVGAINIVLFTALATVAAFIYNAAAAMSGGVELTLGERD